MPLNRLFRECGHAGWNLAIDRDICDPNFLHGSNKRARFSRMPVEESFSFQRCQVLHYRRLARESEVLLNFARARRDSFLSLLELDKFQNAALSLSEHANIFDSSS